MFLGYIDLSKRRVSAEDVIKCEERFNKSKMVHSILRHVAEKTREPIENLYEKIGWPLMKKYGHAVDAFKYSITYVFLPPESNGSHSLTLLLSNADVWDGIEFPSDAVREELTTYISKRLTPQPTKVRADVNVQCFGYEGIEAVKTALRTAEAMNTPETPIKVKLVSPPLYVLTSQCLDKNVGIQALGEAIDKIKESIEAAGGDLRVMMAPKAVTEADDADLQALMDKREKENAEVSGDEDESVSEED